MDLEDRIEFKLDQVEYEQPLSELQLENINWVEVRTALNRAPSQYAYWSNILATVEQKLRKEELAFEAWYAEQYQPVDAVSRASTSESAKKMKVLINCRDLYMKKRGRISRLLTVRDKVSAIVRGYDLHARVLQTIGGLLRAEVGLAAGGSGIRTSEDL